MSRKASASPTASPTARPVVAFVDSHTWEAFSALAGALRLRGIDVEHIVAKPDGPRVRLLQTLDIPLYGRPQRLIELPTRPGAAATLTPAAVAAVRSPRVIDVEAHDDLAAELALTGDPLTDPARFVGPGVDPGVLSDKWVLAQILKELSIPAPTVWLERDARSFPVVLKARTGFAGIGVRVVHDQAEFDAAWDDLTKMSGVEPFVQEFVANRMIDTGGVAKAGQIVVAGVYDALPDPSDPTGPSINSKSLLDARPMQLTEDFIRGIGYTGFFNLDWLLADDGTPMLIDFNARVFGSWPALQAFGIDFVSAYLYVLGLGPRPANPPVEPGQLEGVLKFPFPTPKNRADVWRERKRALGIIKSRRSWLGNRWAAVSRAKVELGVVQALAGLRRK